MLIETVYAKLHAFRAHMPYAPLRFKLLRAYVPTGSHFSRANVLTCQYMFFVPTPLRAINCLVLRCAHFPRTYVPATTQNRGTDIYLTDVKSDENLGRDS